MNRVLTFLAIATVAVAIVCCTLLRSNIQEMRRLEQNQESLMGSVQSYKTAADRSAASAAILELRLEELRKLRAEDAEQIRSLGIRLRRAESYAKSVTQTKSNATIALRDTVIVCDTLQIIDSDMGYTTLRGSILNDTLRLNITHRDTLYQVVHRVPRKFLFFKFGTRAIHQDVWSSNPDSEILFTEYIELETRKKGRRREGKRQK